MTFVLKGDDLDWELAFIRASGIRPAATEESMGKKRNRRREELPVLHPDAAGIDIGASELFVAVAANRDPQPVRSFPTFTRDLHSLADWLQQCGIRSVSGQNLSNRSAISICCPEPPDLGVTFLHMGLSQLPLAALEKLSPVHAVVDDDAVIFDRLAPAIEA